MAEHVRSIKYTVEIETNKRTIKKEFRHERDLMPFLAMLDGEGLDAAMALDDEDDT